MLDGPLETKLGIITITFYCKAIRPLWGPWRNWLRAKVVGRLQVLEVEAGQCPGILACVEHQPLCGRKSLADSPAWEVAASWAARCSACCAVHSAVSAAPEEGGDSGPPRFSPRSWRLLFWLIRSLLRAVYITVFWKLSAQTIKTTRKRINSNQFMVLIRFLWVLLTSCRSMIDKNPRYSSFRLFTKDDERWPCWFLFLAHGSIIDQMNRFL